jgi:hypothetical protein
MHNAPCFTVASPAVAPRFTHDCDKCRFVGGTDGGDWYICGDVHFGDGEYIRRYGNDGPDYSAGSGLVAMSWRFEEGRELYRAFRSNGGRITGAPIPEVPKAEPPKPRKPRAPRAPKPPPVRGELGYIAPEWEADIAHFRGNAPAARDLLSVRSFRSDFRREMRDLIVAWLETPAAERKYSSPLSDRQWAWVQPYDPRARRW